METKSSKHVSALYDKTYEVKEQDSIFLWLRPQLVGMERGCSGDSGIYAGKINKKSFWTPVY